MTSSSHRDSTRISRDQALTCCVPGQVFAQVVLPGGATHRLSLNDATGGLAPHLLEAATEFWTAEPAERSAPASVLLQRVEQELAPEEREAPAVRERQAKERTLGVRLVDHDTGEPLAGVDLAALGLHGKTSRSRTDIRGRGSFQGLGADR